MIKIFYNKTEANEVAEGGGEGGASDSEVSKMIHHHHWDVLKG